MSFQLSLEGWQRFSGNDVIGNRVPDSWGSDREGSTANGSRRDRRHQDTVRVGIAECSTTRHIDDADEWPEVAWCTSMQHFERVSSVNKTVSLLFAAFASHILK